MQDLILAIVYLLPVIIVVVIILVILRPFFSKWNAKRKEKKAARKAMKAEKNPYAATPRYHNPFQKNHPDAAGMTPNAPDAANPGGQEGSSAGSDDGKSE